MTSFATVWSNSKPLWPRSDMTTTSPKPSDAVSTPTTTESAAPTIDVWGTPQTWARYVVQGDRQVVVIEPPKLLEGELGLESRVDEHQGDPRLLDRLVDLRHRVLGGVAGPRHAALGQQHVHDRRRAGGAARTRSTASCVVGVSQRRITSGSSTVAESPTRRRFGANCCRRARPSESRRLPPRRTSSDREVGYAKGACGLGTRCSPPR